jgi:hypothetical protein
MDNPAVYLRRWKDGSSLRNEGERLTWIREFEDVRADVSPK